MNAVSIVVTVCGLLLWGAHLVYRVRVSRSTTRSWMWSRFLRPQSDARRELNNLRREADDLIERIAAASQRHGDDSVVSALATKLAVEVPMAVATAMDRETGRSYALIREINHSLNTPLGHIETAALLLRDTSAEPGTVDSLITAVEMCKAFLGAFREMGSLGLNERIWTPASLGQLLRESIEVYSARNNKKCVTHVRLPDSYAGSGYSNNFLIGLLLPLVENAVEAIPAKGGDLFVEARPAARYLTILVTNTNDGRVFIPESVYEPHMTTKKGHTGMGLVAVRHLLSAHTGADLTHAVADGRTTFEITLPGRFAR